MNKNLQSDKKSNILMAAVRGLTNKGYYSRTMDDIVAESRMSKGAIYHYYSSKKDVYLAVIDMWENQTQELLAPAGDEDSSAKAIKKLFNLPQFTLIYVTVEDTSKSSKIAILSFTKKYPSSMLAETKGD